MSGEPDAVVGPARRAFAELSEPAGRLLSDFAAAEDGARALEPELLLLELDVFGGIAIPARAARGEDERRARRAQLALARLAGAAGGAQPAPDAAAQRGRAPGLPDTAPPRGSSSTTAAGAAAGAELLPPVFPLRGGAAHGPAARGAASGVAGEPEAGGAAPGVTEPPTVPAAAVQAGAGPGVATTGTPPRAAPEAAALIEATGGTLELIGQLTEAILAANASAAATAPSTAGSPATPAAENSTDSFLVETLRSLGGETAAAFGVESAGAPVRASPSPTAGTAGGPGADLGAAATPAVRENGVTPRAAEPEPDPATLAALVNDALVEQARRHGLELG